MKKKTKVLLSSLLAIGMSASLATGATYALFTSESTVNVAVTSGTVNVTATASDVKTLSRGVERTGAEALTFENGGAVTHTAETNSIAIDKITPLDEVRFKITIANESNVNVQYRTVISVLEDEGLFEALTVSFADSEAELGTTTAVAYDGITSYQPWADLAPNSEDKVVYVSIAFPDGEDQNKYQGLKTKLSYRVEAVQGNATVVDPVTEIDGMNYEINSAEGMMLIEPIINKISHGEGRTLNFKLTANVDMTGYEWMPLSMLFVNFDGNGHTISNLTCTNTDWGRSGFVGYLGGSRVENVVLKNVTAVGTQVGIVAASVEGGAIENVTIEGSNSVQWKNVNPKESWDGVGAVSGVATSNPIVNVTVNGTISVDYNGMTTDSACKYVGKVQGFGTGYNSVSVVTGADNVTTTGSWEYEMKVSDTTEFSSALNELQSGESAEITLTEGTYKMPSVSGSKEFTIVGTKDTVIDNTMGSYMDSSKVSFEGVTIKGSTGMANGNGSDYAALYCPNVTYTNCTFDGPFRIGRDGAKFINCTFTNLGNDYVWTYGNDVEFIGCTFETDGKAILVYSDGGNEVSKVTVKNCTFNATKGAKASAIANQNCAAIEIHNYGNGVNLTTSGNTFDSNFSGEWRIKTYETGKPKVFVNGTEYTTIALDGVEYYKDANNNVYLATAIFYDSSTMGGLYEYLPTLQSGAILVLPEGTYTTSGTFTVPAGVTIMGQIGKEVVFHQNSTAQDNIFNCEGDAVFENIIFESNRKGYAICDNTHNHDTDGNITVINCKFKGIAAEKNYGIYKNLNGNLTVENCTFENYNNAICGVNNGNGSTTVITGCTFTNINGEAIGYVSSTVPADFETEVIANNTGLTAENVIGY